MDFGESFPCKTQNAGDDGENGEATDLDRFPAEAIYCEHRHPIPRYRSLEVVRK